MMTNDERGLLADTPSLSGSSNDTTSVAQNADLIDARKPALTDAPKPALRRRAPALVRVRNSAIHGRGVFARRRIKQGERIIEQRGLRISHEECDSLDSNSTESGHTFLFTLNDHYVIDTNRGGNAARWINHGCAPNCESEYEEDDQGRPLKDRIFINATRDIANGEELTYDYCITLDEVHTEEIKKIWQCLCGSDGCKGTMLTD